MSSPCATSSNAQPSSYGRSLPVRLVQGLADSPVSKIVLSLGWVCAGAYDLYHHYNRIPLIAVRANLTFAAIALLYTISSAGKTRVYHELGLGGLRILTYCRASIIPWRNPINEHISLGALPVTREHFNQIRSESETVLSIVEPFELRGIGFLSDPVTESDWAGAHISHKVIDVRDNEAPTIEQIREGVSFIHEHVQINNRVHVHCKAGKGRSALLVICYLMQHQGMTFNFAYGTVKQARRIVKLNATQIGATRAFERSLANPSLSTQTQ